MLRILLSEFADSIVSRIADLIADEKASSEQEWARVEGNVKPLIVAAWAEKFPDVWESPELKETLRGIIDVHVLEKFRGFCFQKAWVNFLFFFFSKK